METLLIEMIENLIKDAGFSLYGLGLTKLDLHTTVRMAMSPEEHKDLMAMIQYLIADKKLSLPAIMTEAIHDLAGFKAIYLNDPHGTCFAPRSSGYSSLPVV